MIQKNWQELIKPNKVEFRAKGSTSVTLTAERPGLARALYRQGAWVVLPAGLRGCLPMPRL